MKNLHTSKTCFILNVGPHYRLRIYAKIGKELHCSFFIGDKINSELKTFDYQKLDGFRKLLRNRYILGNFYWQSGAVRTCFLPYRSYVLTGEPYCLSSWFILVCNKLLNKKSYLWSHGWYGDEAIVKSLIKKLYFSLSDGVFLYGEYARGIMINYGFNKDKLHVIYNSLDYDLQISIRNKLKPSDVFARHFCNDLPVIIFTGRLTKVKKLEQLVEAHSLLFNKGYLFNIVLVGDGSEEIPLRYLIEERNLTQFYWFFGPCYDEEKISELYFNATICVSPGNVGLTAIHSMTYGCPVLSHNNFSLQMPEFESIQEGKTGFFFNENNIEDLADKILLSVDAFTDNEETRKNCFQVIDDCYNPNFQIQILKSLIL